MASEKDLREHNHVKTYVQKRLSAVCEDVTFGTLTLKKLANVQHLHTPVTARIVPGRSLLDAAQPLHPTSAVGGEPRETAIRLIREIEGFDRGWYAGLVGWLEPGQTQQGELCVAIRSAVITGDEAVLYAGAGIVEGSDPELEDRETQIKMQAILEALN
jgi:isochorismate synthase EntC